MDITCPIGCKLANDFFPGKKGDHQRTALACSCRTWFPCGLLQGSFPGALRIVGDTNPSVSRGHCLVLRALPSADLGVHSKP